MTTASLGYLLYAARDGAVEPEVLGPRLRPPATRLRLIPEPGLGLAVGTDQERMTVTTPYQRP